MSTAATPAIRPQLSSSAPSDARWAAAIALAGTVLMATGAAIWASTGTDIDAALDSGNLAGYLEGVQASRGGVVANLSVWIVGIITMGVGCALTVLTQARRALAGQLGALTYVTGATLAVVSYVVMLTLAVVVAPAASSDLTAATALAWLGSRLDWIGTILVLGVGPVVQCVAGDLPRALHAFAAVAGLAALVTAISLFTGTLATLGFLVIPIGMLWHFAALTVLVRRT